MIKTIFKSKALEYFVMGVMIIAIIFVISYQYSKHRDYYCNKTGVETKVSNKLLTKFNKEVFAVN